MKTLDMHGKLVRMGANKEWFTVRFDKNLVYMNKEFVGKYAEIYELERKNEYYGLTIERAEWVILWGEAPKGTLEVTFNNPKKLEPPLNVYARFYLMRDEDHEDDSIYLEM